MKKHFTFLGIIFFAAGFFVIHEGTGFAQHYPSYPAGQAVVAPTPVYAHQGGYYGMGTSSDCSNGGCGTVTYGGGGCGSCGDCGGCEAPLSGFFHWIWNGCNYWDGPGCSERVLDEWRKSWVACPQCNVFGERLNAGPNSLGTGYRSWVILQNANPHPQEVPKVIPAGYYPNQGVPMENHGHGMPATGSPYPSYPVHSNPGGCSSCQKGITVTANSAPINPSVGTMTPVNYAQRNNAVYPVSPQASGQQNINAVYYAPNNYPQNNTAYPQQGMIYQQPTYPVVPANVQMSPTGVPYRVVPAQNNAAPTQNPSAGQPTVVPVSGPPQQMIYRTSYYPSSSGGWENAKPAAGNVPQAVPAVLGQPAGGNSPRPAFTSENFFQGGKDKTSQVPGYIRAQQAANQLQETSFPEIRAISPADVTAVPEMTSEAPARSAYKNRPTATAAVYHENISARPASAENGGWVTAPQYRQVENAVYTAASVPLHPISQGNDGNPPAQVRPVSLSDSPLLMETLPAPAPRATARPEQVSTQAADYPPVAQKNFAVQPPGNTNGYSQTPSGVANSVLYTDGSGYMNGNGVMSVPAAGGAMIAGHEYGGYGNSFGPAGCAPCGGECFDCCPEFQRPCLFPCLRRVLGCLLPRRPLMCCLPFNGFFASRFGCCRGGCEIMAPNSLYGEYGGLETPADFEYANGYVLNGIPGNAVRNMVAVSPSPRTVGTPYTPQVSYVSRRTDELLSLTTQRILLEDGTEVILEHDRTREARLAVENSPDFSTQGSVNAVSYSENPSQTLNFPAPGQNLEDYPIIAVEMPQIQLAPGEILVSQQDIPLIGPQNAPKYGPASEEYENREKKASPLPARKTNVTNVSYSPAYRQGNDPETYSAAHSTGDDEWITVYGREKREKPLPRLKPATPI